MSRRRHNKVRARADAHVRKSWLYLTRNYPELCNNKRPFRRRQFERPVYEFRLASYPMLWARSPSTAGVIVP